MITMDAKTVFVGVCVALLIHGCCSQKLTFNSPIHYNGTCGLSDGQGIWTTTGTIELTKADQIMFAPTLEINTFSPICSLDLTKCLSEGSILDKPGECYCQKQANGLLKVNIGAQADPAHSGLSVQALIPSYDTFGQITASVTIGTIPTVPGKRPPVKPTYQVDDGLLQPFLPVQTVKVCPNVFVTINFCVEDKAPGSELQINIKRMTMTSDEKCLEETKKFNFESTSSHKMTFAYKESIDCIQSHISILLIEEKQSGCLTTTATSISDTTTPETTTTTPETTATTQETTATTPETTTTTPETTATTQETTATNPKTTTTTPRVPDCPSPDVVKYLSPGMTQMCDSIDGGKWTTIQRRTSDKVDFYRKWVDYENGFGEQPDNYWLGLKALHHLCYPGNCQLRFDLEYKGKKYFAKYDRFTVEGADTQYKMFVSGYHGNAGDNGKAASAGNGFMYHSGMSFSTFDSDNDKRSGNCAEYYRGGFWYNRCHKVNLNGIWGSENSKGLIWYALTGWEDSVTVSEMKVRQQN